MSELTTRATSPVILYTTGDGKVTVDVWFANDNFWLTQKAMAELFGVKTPAVNKHLKNIFTSGELVEDSVISILETTAADGNAIAGRLSLRALQRRSLEILDRLTREGEA